ncbi:MAG: flagellar protein FliT [Pseudomonadota bacterium]|nr:flagellar protein FliT [Pseudomonadota bacterium]
MMNDDQVISLYETVSDITSRMLQAAQLRDWENLAVLESHCASQIECLKEHEPVARLSGPVRARKVAILHQILAHDREIRNLTTPWLAELAALINSSGATRKLSAAYGA